jgi:lysophospholipase L1-like esterase
MARSAALALLFFSLMLPATAFAVNIAPLGGHSVILAFGDSITHGTGAAAGASYPAVLEKLLGVTVVNAGVPGELSKAGTGRLQDLLEEYRPSLVIICHGGNDLIQGRPYREISENLRKMARAVKQTAADLVIVGVPEPGPRMAVPPFYEDVSRETGALYEGRSLRSILSNSAFKSDLIHPNAKGYARLAEELAALIESAQW